VGTLEQLNECIYKGSGVRDDVNPILCWHGTKTENLNSICEQGLKLKSTNDEGWFGKGIYFTQLPCYGEYYINQCGVTMGVNEFSLLLCWVVLGNPNPIVTDEYRGADCRPNFHSHYALVHDFSPIYDGPIEEANGDEIVIFNESQCIPRYIVHYNTQNKAEFDEYLNSHFITFGQTAPGIPLHEGHCVILTALAMI